MKNAQNLRISNEATEYGMIMLSAMTWLNHNYWKIFLAIDLTGFTEKNMKLTAFSGYLYI